MRAPLSRLKHAHGWWCCGRTFSPGSGSHPRVGWTGTFRLFDSGSQWKRCAAGSSSGPLWLSQLPQGGTSSSLWDGEPVGRCSFPGGESVEAFLSWSGSLYHSALRWISDIQNFQYLYIRWRNIKTIYISIIRCYIKDMANKNMSDLDYKGGTSWPISSSQVWGPPGVLKGVAGVWMCTLTSNLNMNEITFLTLTNVQKTKENFAWSYLFLRGKCSHLATFCRRCRIFERRLRHDGKRETLLSSANQHKHKCYNTDVFVIYDPIWSRLEQDCDIIRLKSCIHWKRPAFLRLECC